MDLQSGPELTTSVRLPVVVFPTERHAVEIGALLLPEVTRPGRTGLQTHRRRFCEFVMIKCFIHLQ